VLDEESEDIVSRNDMPSMPSTRRGAPPRLPRELAEAYRLATYVVDTPQGELRFTIGHRSARLDRLLAGLGVERAAFLTAANPGSRRLSAEENSARTTRLGEQLQEQLAEAGLVALAGEGRDESGDWRERSFLVPGIEREAALALARKLGQAAFVLLESGRPPKLVPT